MRNIKVYEFNDINKNKVMLGSSCFIVDEKGKGLRFINTVTHKEYVIKGNGYILNSIRINLENGVEIDVLKKMLVQIPNGEEYYEELVGGFYLE